MERRQGWTKRAPGWVRDFGSYAGLLGLVPLTLSCGVSHGDGEVSSDHLYAADCVDGPFDLRPDYFASNPELDTQLITLQHGDRLHDLSDGVLISVYQVSNIIDEHLGQAVEVALPPGVTPPGHAPSEEELGFAAM